MKYVSAGLLILIGGAIVASGNPILGGIVIAVGAGIGIFA